MGTAFARFDRWRARSAASSAFSFAGHRVDGRSCGPDPSETAWQKSLFDHYAKAIRECAEGRTPWEGDGRYLLVADDQGRDQVFAGAPSWPLASDPLAVAVTRGAAEGASGELASLTHHVSGDDAKKLRALRTTFEGSGLGPRQGIDFIPIQQADGTRYQLMFRDALPFEDDKGQLRSREDAALNDRA